MELYYFFGYLLTNQVFVYNYCIIFQIKDIFILGL